MTSSFHYRVANIRTLSEIYTRKYNQLITNLDLYVDCVCRTRPSIDIETNVLPVETL